MNKLKLLDIFYGNKCNLTCFQCDTRSDLFRKGEYDPDLENIKEGIRLATAQFDIEIYALLGGEPLMYLDKVEEIVKFVRAIAPTKKIVIPTNGSLLDKHISRIANLIVTYDMSLNICDHFSGFEDKTKSNKVKKSAMLLAEKLNLISKNSTQFYFDILSWDDPSKEWQEWVLPRGGTELGEDDGNLFWRGPGKQSVYYHTQDRFHQHHHFIGTSPKPFAEGNPEDSYLHGCCSPFCSFMYDKKIYKCGALGTLQKFLDSHNAIDDPDWSKYLSYKPLDLVNCTLEEVNHFTDTNFKAIKECEMCPSSTREFSRTPDTVLPNGKKYVPINKVG
jgi:organic radical activating enzyme